VRRGGAAFVAAAVKRAVAECAGCATVLLDGGDEFQGTPASNLALGAPVTELFNRMGYAASALGNHEFDWGTSTLRERMRGARYGILAANVRYTDGRDVPWIRDDTLVTRGGIRIGVIGVATISTPATTRAANTVGLRFDDPAPVVDAHARALRKRGAAVIVVIAHAGAFCSRDGATDCAGEIVDLANRLTEPVDAIVSGHTHSLVNTVVKGIPIAQARSSGQAVAVLDLDLTPGHSGIARQAIRDVVDDSLSADAGVDSIVRRAVAKVAPLVSKQIATIAEPMRRSGNQYALGNYIADAERWAGKSDIAVTNNGGIRADLPAGLATYGTLFEVQPFANVLYKVSVSGAELRDYLEKLVTRNEPNVHVSGVTLSFDPTKPAGSRLLSATLDGGRAIDSATTYTVVLSDFLVTGGDGLGLASRAGGARNLNIVDLDALIDYTKSRAQPVTAPAGARIVPRQP
jgi:2',3'-cyclic-nucleotide 2'-phosphodiesterase (5'-nucleotidase family)